MEIKSGLHEPNINPLNQQSTFGSGSVVPVFKTFDPSRGTPSSRKSTNVSKRSLTNIINHLHFTKEYLWAHIQGQTLQENFLVKLYPGPCLDDEIVLTLPAAVDINLQGYIVHKLIIEDGRGQPLSQQLLGQRLLPA